MSGAGVMSDNSFKFFLNDVFYTPSYNATDAYFAERKFIKSETLSDKTHLYEMKNSHKTEIIKKDKVIDIIADKSNKDLSCNLDEVTKAIKNANFTSGYTTAGTPLSPVNVYDSKGASVGTVIYSFTGVNNVSTLQRQKHIAGLVKDNIKKDIVATSADVEKALDATQNKNFKAGDPLKNIPVSYKGQPIGKIEYLFNGDTDLSYKTSKERKEVIDDILKVVNEKYPNKYMTTYEKVDEILPEKVEGKSKGDKQTKLNIPMYEIEEKFVKIDGAGLSEKVYVVVKTNAPLGVTLNVKAYEKETLLVKEKTALPFASNIISKRSVSIFDADFSTIRAMSYGQGEAIGEVLLEPFSEAEQNTWKEKLTAKEAKKEIVAKLWLEVNEKDEFLKGNEFSLKNNELITKEMINAVCPTQGEDSELLQYLNEYAKKYEVNSKYRIAHFISQIAHESCFKATEEDLHFTLKRAKEIWSKKRHPKFWENSKYFEKEGSRFLDPIKYANYVYGNRTDLGNGNEASGDGYKYRGRGLIQLTGKNNYTSFTKIHNKKSPEDKKDFLKAPDLIVNNKKYAIESAFIFWDIRQINKLADNKDVTIVTKKINGGINGLSDREVKFNKIIKIMEVK